MLTLNCVWKEAFTVKWKKGGEISRSDGVTHHILPGILPRCNEDVVPGQRQQQSHRNQIEFKVPNNNDKNLIREKKKRKTVRKRKARTKKWEQCGLRMYTFSTPYWPSGGKLLRTYTDHMCDWKRHIFKHIHMQNHNHSGTKRKNKAVLQQRYGPGVGEPRFSTLTLEVFWAFSWGEGRWGRWVRAVGASFLHANHPRAWGHVLFQPQHVKADPSILKPKPQHLTSHTPHPETLTLSLQAPIPSLVPQKTCIPHF